jgi:hypothetical protein
MLKTAFFREQPGNNLLENNCVFWYDKGKNSGGRVPAPIEGGVRGMCFCLPAFYHHHGGMGWCKVREKYSSRA